MTNISNIIIFVEFLTFNEFSDFFVNFVDWNDFFLYFNVSVLSFIYFFRTLLMNVIYWTKYRWSFRFKSFLFFTKLPGVGEIGSSTGITPRQVVMSGIRIFDERIYKTAVGLCSVEFAGAVLLSE